MECNEIIVFTEGDSNNSNVWSNVPYFLTKTLEAKGYQVHRVNVLGSRIKRVLYDKFLCRILRKTFMRNTSFSYNRSKTYTKEVQSLMRRAVGRYPDACCFISTSFSYAPASYTDKPAVLFCDWTYDYYINYFLKRTPDFLELAEIIRQDNVIEHADAVFVLFPDIADYMQKHYKNKNIYYLGNVINAEPFYREPASLSVRQADANILFIGLSKYMEGAKSLIQAVIGLHQTVPNITLDIIGMDSEDFQSLPSYVNCHGYLNKDIMAEKELYYSLIDHSTVYVNTTPLWAGFSSSLEALHHYVPVITTPYPSFVETFGDTIAFGYLCSQNSADAIIGYIKQLLALPADQYLNMCLQAHLAVQEFTWESYVTKLLAHIDL